MWNGTAETLKASPTATKTRPMISPVDGLRRAGRTTWPSAGKAGGAGEAVDQRGAVEQHPRGERAEDEIFEPGLGRAHRIAVEAGDDVERQALQFEAEIERDQVVGRDHDHHAGGRQQDQHRELEARDAVLLVVAQRHDDA